MKKIIGLGLVFIISFLISHLSFSQNADAITGTWLNEEKEAKIEIFKNGNKYFGKIIWLKFPNNEQNVAKTDVHNPEEKLRGRKIMGLQILWDFEYVSGSLWENGKIYDPKKGKTYSCKMTLVNKNKLDVRGFVGFSLIGRTTTWTRSN